MRSSRVLPPSKPPLLLMASILGAALRSGHAGVYLSAAADAFHKMGRDDDAMALAYMCELHAMGEIEILMTLRAQWLGER